MSRPIPPHGTSARAYGSPGYRPPCKCTPCRDARRRAEKRAKYNRTVGRSPFVSPEKAREHLAQLHEKLSWPDLVAKTDIPLANLLTLYSGGRTKIRVATEQRILNVPLPAHASPGKVIDPTGSARRLQALLAAGHSLRTVASHADTNKDVLRKICNGDRGGVRQSLAVRIARAFDTLADVPKPTGKHAQRTRNVALSRGWAPVGAWDADTIDDPNAIPEWTGFCGTDRGWWTHRIENIPVCPACQTAHDEWLQQHKSLSPSDRYRAMGRARAEASNRGAAIAEDGRELLRLGATYDTAAQRLGITRAHLQQQLIRHPETTKEAA